MRLQLQENMEALANQMHGLEDEARQSVQGALPVLPTASSPSSVLTTPGSSTSDIAVAMPDAVKMKPTVSEKVYPPDPDMHDGYSAPGGYDSDDEDEDKFFDAPEMSPEDLVKSKDAELAATPGSPDSRLPCLPVGHRRSFSTTSVNDTSSMQCASSPDVKEQLPQVSSDRRMEVSSCYSAFTMTYIHFSCQVPAAPSASFFEGSSLPTIAERRTRIPPKPNHKMNLWTVMKNCIGKDLSKIPMPVSSWCDYM